MTKKQQPIYTLVPAEEDYSVTEYYEYNQPTFKGSRRIQEEAERQRYLIWLHGEKVQDIIRETRKINQTYVDEAHGLASYLQAKLDAEKDPEMRQFLMELYRRELPQFGREMSTHRQEGVRQFTGLINRSFEPPVEKKGILASWFGDPDE